MRAVLQRLIARHGTEMFFWADVMAPNAQLPERRFHLRRADAA
jgi:hypothetical protein